MLGPDKTREQLGPTLLSLCSHLETGPGFVQNGSGDKGFEAHRGYLVATLPLDP